MRVICENCNGEGILPDPTSVQVCPKCFGQGWFPLDIDILYDKHITQICHLNEDVYNSLWVKTMSQIETLYEQNT